MMLSYICKLLSIKCLKMLIVTRFAASQYLFYSLVMSLFYSLAVFIPLISYESVLQPRSIYFTH